MPKREEDLPRKRNVFEVLVYLCFQNCITLTVSQYSHTLIQKLKIQFTQNFQNLFENGSLEFALGTNIKSCPRVSTEA